MGDLIKPYTLFTFFLRIYFLMRVMLFFSYKHTTYPERCIIYGEGSMVIPNAEWEYHMNTKYDVAQASGHEDVECYGRSNYNNSISYHER